MRLHAKKLALAVAGVIACTTPLLAPAQQAATTTEKFASEPGKAMIARTTKASAVVTALDKEHRIVTLKTASGKVVEMVADAEIKNFDQMKVGDHVHVEYVEALSLELKKSGKGALAATEKSGAMTAPAGEKPGAAAGRQLTVLADVVSVDAKKQVVTMKGPQGNLVDLHVQDPSQMKHIKKGDQIEAVYTEAVAVKVETEPKK
jgi:Cu/Ag efflux protein CusF